LGTGLAGIITSPITGSAGNVEFVACLISGRPNMPDSEQALDAVVVEATTGPQSGQPAARGRGEESRQGQDD
ncbi:MAG: hypothetical protein AAGA65_22575, partial [Actinomycetota bacterium]